MLGSDTRSANIGAARRRQATPRLAKARIPAGQAAAEALAPIAVEIAGPARFAALTADWADLLARADIPNVSMHPAVVEAAAASGAELRVVLAWRGDEARQLVGVWVLGLGRLFRRWPTRVLLAPSDRNLILGAPVVDREVRAETLSAMFEALSADRSLPAILCMKDFPGEGALHDALRRVLARRRAGLMVLKRLLRPKLVVGLDAEAYLERALSGKRRSSLRRYRRRLTERGALEVTTHQTPGDVPEAFEAFLALEASGWKGRAGSALIQRGDATLAFLRRMIAGLAAHGLVTITALRLDGRPVAMDVTLRCGSIAHTWKCAYDEALRSQAPGFLLTEHLTRTLLADASLAFVDMSNDKAFADPNGVSAFWMERHEIVDLLIEIRRTGPFGFRLAALASRLRTAYRAARRRSRPGKELPADPV